MLLFCGEYHLARSKPLIHEDHALNASGHRRPKQIFLSLPAQVRAAPQMEHIVIGAVAHTLTAFQNLLNKGIIKEALNKIAAFFFIRLGCKECGNFHAMAIQFFTGSEQFVLFLILMEILRFPSQIPVSSA